MPRSMPHARWLEKYNRWQCLVTINGERRSFYSSTPGRAGQRECEAKAAEWSEAGASKDAKVSSVWADFLQHYKRTGQEETYIKTESFGRLYVLPMIGNRKMSTIRPRDWQRIIDAQHERGLHKKTLCNIRGACRTFVKWSKKQEYKCGEVEVDIPADAPTNQKRIATGNQIAALFSTDTVTKVKYPTRFHWARLQRDREWYAYGYRFVVVNGLRRGELAGIREDDIVDGVLYIRRARNRLNKETKGKNENASRAIGLSQISLKLIDQQRALKQWAGYDTPWLFCGPDGEQIETNAFYKEWHSFFGPQLGILCSLHELRHTFVSAVKVDMPLALLKEMAGHSDDTDSLGIYGHEFDDDLIRMANICDKVFNKFVPTYV